MEDQTIKTIPLYEFKNKVITLKNDTSLLNLLYDQMIAPMDKQKNINLFLSCGNYNNIRIYKDNVFMVEENKFIPLIPYVRSEIKSKFLDENHPKFKKIMRNYKNFKNYLICNLHKNNIFSESDNKGSGFYFGDYRVGFAFPDIMEIFGDYLVLEKERSGSPLNQKERKEHGLKVLKEELKIIGNITNILFSVFEEINNPNYVITDASFISEDKNIENISNDLIRSFSGIPVVDNIRIQNSFNNFRLKLLESNLY